MPLLNHFAPPLSERRNWESFHGLWAGALVENLNDEILGDEYHAEMQLHIGSRIEVDVATLDDVPAAPPGGGGVLAPAWAPPRTALILPMVFPDEVEVQVLSTSAGPTLVGAIELVSPANKDRDSTRRAFAAKCLTYLTHGVGLIVVDVVTSRLANLHNELMTRLGQGGDFLFPSETLCYAVAYRPRRLESGGQVEIWPVPLALGDDLPTLGLALRNAETVPIDLEGTYAEACRRSRV